MIVDTNVLLDLFTNDPRWAAWSSAQIERALSAGTIIINDVIYAELSVRFPTIELLDEVVKGLGLVHTAFTREALFLAGKAFARYRAAGGPRPSILSDFLIGAHAAAAELPILTRDARRYRSYFPTVALITP